MLNSSRNNIFILIVLTILNCLLGYQIRDAPLLNERPHWLKVCRRTDPELNSCMTNMFSSMFPQLAKGIPEIKVDPFEPLPLDKVSISKGTGAIKLSGSLYNLNIAGPSNATPTFTEFNKEQKRWNFDMEIPLLDINSLYNLKGNILVLPLVGQGKCELKLFKIETKVWTNITFPLVEGREIVKIESMKVKFDVGGMKIRLYNLFNGNKILGQTVNHFINQNALDVVQDLEESISSSLAVIFKDLINNIFSKIPTDLWYLTDEQYEEYIKKTNTN